MTTHKSASFNPVTVILVGLFFLIMVTVGFNSLFSIDDQDNTSDTQSYRSTFSQLFSSGENPCRPFVDDPDVDCTFNAKTNMSTFTKLIRPPSRPMFISTPEASTVTHYVTNNGLECVSPQGENGFSCNWAKYNRLVNECQKTKALTRVIPVGEEYPKGSFFPPLKGECDNVTAQLSHGN